MWRAGSWHCAECGYDNYRENVGCRKCGVGRKAEGRDGRRRERSVKREKDRRSEKLTRRKSSRSCDKKDESHIGERLTRRKITGGKLKDKEIDMKKVASGSGKKIELDVCSPSKVSSKELSIISPAGYIKKLEKFTDGKTPLWVKTFPNIVEYFGKFGTISGVREENNGISKITFYEKSSALKALSSIHKHCITFYEYSNEGAGHHAVEDTHREPEDSRVKALKNYEADVNSFLFGTEDLQGTSTTARSGNIKKVKKKDSKFVNDDSKSEKKVSASVYSRRTFSKKPKFHIPPGEFFVVEDDIRFVKEAENNKWKIAVEKFESMKDGVHVKFNQKFDDDEREHDAGGGVINIKTIVKAARVPNILERRLLAMAGSYKDPGSGKVVLRSRNSDENNTELVDIADSDEEVIDVVENEHDHQSKLIDFEKASDKEKEVILKSMGIVSRVREPLVVEERELVDLGDSVSKDTEPPVLKARELLDISDSDIVPIGIVPPVVKATEIVDLSVSKDTDPPVVEAGELVDPCDSVSKDTEQLVLDAREFVELSDSDTGLFSDGSEGMS